MTSILRDGIIYEPQNTKSLLSPLHHFRQTGAYLDEAMTHLKSLKLQAKIVQLELNELKQMIQ